MIRLPAIMVAPNGARRMPSDHPAIPITISDTVATAKACYEAGAGGIHGHVRNDRGRHVLDAGLYRELIAELAREVPDMVVQITTEAVGIFSPDQQIAVVRAVRPAAVSVALREMAPGDDDTAKAADFYHWAHDEGIAVQHILYAGDEVERFARLVSAGMIPAQDQELLFVLGRYSADMESDPSYLSPFLEAYYATGLRETCEWMVCAFGRRETLCLRAALSRGGKVRVGFENNFFNDDGSIAADNGERVREIVACRAAAG